VVGHTTEARGVLLPVQDGQINIHQTKSKFEGNKKLVDCYTLCSFGVNSEEDVYVFFLEKKLIMHVQHSLSYSTFHTLCYSLHVGGMKTVYCKPKIGLSF